MKNANKIVKIALDLIDVKFNLNVREADLTSYDLPIMRESLAANGQLVAVTLEKVGDRYEILRGNGRVWNLQKLRAEGVIDPTTVDPNVEGSGKVFEYANAEVYEKLTDAERWTLRNDHSDARSLRKWELFYSFEQGFAAMLSEKQIISQQRNLLETHFPPRRKVEVPAEPASTYDERLKQAYLEYYRGVLQAMKIAWSAPTIARDAYVLKLKGEQAWPSDKDLRALVKIYQDEKDADVTRKTGKNNPGPKFLAEWAKLLAAVEKAKTDGANKPKSISQMNNQQVTDLESNFESRTLKVTALTIQRKLSVEAAMAFDKFLADLEAKGIIPSDLLDKVLGSAAAVEEKKAE